MNNPRFGFNIESRCLVTSLLYFFAPQLVTGSNIDENDDDGDLYGITGDSTDAIAWNKLKELLGSYFPACDTDYSRPEDTHPVPDQLLEAIHTQLQERHLQPLPSLIEKVNLMHRRQDT